MQYCRLIQSSFTFILIAILSSFVVQYIRLILISASSHQLLIVRATTLFSCHIFSLHNSQHLPCKWLLLFFFQQPRSSNRMVASHLKNNLKVHLCLPLHFDFQAMVQPCLCIEIFSYSSALPLRLSFQVTVQPYLRI